jgi:hypothetical protein
VRLRDINDNKPQFERPNIEVSVYENEEIGKSLETFKAMDPDQGGKSQISFAIDRSSDRRRQFVIDHGGTVTIQRHLDREDTPRHQVQYRYSIKYLTQPKVSFLSMYLLGRNVVLESSIFLLDLKVVSLLD